MMCKTVRMGLGLLALGFVLLASTNAGANLISNGTFDANINGWSKTGGDGTVLNYQPGPYYVHDGAGSMYLWCQGNPFSGSALSDAFPLSPNTQYTLSFWVMGIDTTQTYARVVTNNDSIPFADVVNPPDNDWAWYSNTFTTGANPGTLGQVQFFTFGTADGRLFIDTVSVVPEPVTMSLLGLGGVAMLLRRRYNG